jgi:hypothetical protein
MPKRLLEEGLDLNMDVVTMIDTDFGRPDDSERYGDPPEVCYIEGCEIMGQWYNFVGAAQELTQDRFGYLCDKHHEELNWLPDRF